MQFPRSRTETTLQNLNLPKFFIIRRKLFAASVV
jgi:hypothetical protein